MNTKSVQVVMSTYNGEKYLKEQIDSILSQEGVMFAFIYEMTDLQIELQIYWLRIKSIKM